MILAYPSNEKLFNDNGLKVLKPQKALIHKEDNGDYYIDIVDVIDYAEFYQAGTIIRANTPWGYQGFRVDAFDKENNNIKIRAKHLYYDSSNYLISDSYIVDKNCNDALDHLNNNCDIQTPFTFLSDVTSINSYRCVRKTLQEGIETILNRWGGHLVRDNWNIAIRDSIQTDNGIVISYSKNLSKLKVNEDWSKVCTKILPVGKDGIKLPEEYLTVSQELYDIPYSKIISFSQTEIEEDNYKDEEGNIDIDAYNNALINDLRNKAIEYLEENKFPKINYTVNASIDKVSDIGDLIYLKHPKCNVNITTNVISIDYDCIQKEYTKIQFGNFKQELKGFANAVNNTIDDKINENTDIISIKFQNDLQSATNSINSLLQDSNVINNGKELFICDTLPKESATYVMRINSAGIGFSDTGINGTFNSAWLIDGTLDMQQINVINLVADLIKGGTLKLGSNLNQNGQLEVYDEANNLIATLNKDGLRMNALDGGYIKINTEVGFAGYDKNDNKTYWVDGDEFHQKKSVIEEEITLVDKIRILPITIYNQNNEIVNDGAGVVASLRDVGG